MKKKNKIITQSTLGWTMPLCWLINKPRNSKPSIESSWENISQRHGIIAPTQFTITTSTAYFCASFASVFSSCRSSSSGIAKIARSSTLPVTRFTETRKIKSLYSRWMGLKTQCTAKTQASCRSFFQITKIQSGI